MIHEIMTYYDYQFANELICRYFSRLWEKKQCTASVETVATNDSIRTGYPTNSYMVIVEEYPYGG